MKTKKRAKPKMFERKRTLEEVIAECAKRNWPIDITRLEQGGDTIHFDFTFSHEKYDRLKITGRAIWNTFNGRLIGHLSTDERFTSDNAKHEGLPWFDELLTVVFA